MLSTLSFFGIALLLGSVPLAIKSTGRIRAYRQSRSWPKAHATIIQSFVAEGSSGDGMSNLPEFAFRYAVHGVEYTSSLHTEGTPFPGTENDLQQMLRRFPAGAKVQVAVKPTDPGCAILDTGFPKAWQFLKRASVIAFVFGLAITLAEAILAK